MQKETEASPVDVAALQVDLLVHGVPQLRSQRVELLPDGGDQAAVDRVHHLRPSTALVTVNAQGCPNFSHSLLMTLCPFSVRFSSSSSSV